MGERDSCFVHVFWRFELFDRNPAPQEPGAMPDEASDKFASTRLTPAPVGTGDRVKRWISAKDQPLELFSSAKDALKRRVT
jgi:hypothetical protein